MESLTFLLLLLQAASVQLVAPTQLSAPTPAYSLTISRDSLSEINDQAFLGNEDLFEDSLRHLYQVIQLQNYELSYDVFKHAMTGYYTLRQQGRLSERSVLSIIDFTKSSRSKRFYTIDLNRHTVLFHTYVSHGKNTGEDMAKSFSNVLHSNQSSIGFYVTGETYVGSKGYSLKLDGVEQGYNDNMRERAVVMHNAEYVSENWIKKYGRLGRSQGCPALPQEIGKRVIDSLKNKTMIFAYFNDEHYLSSSQYLDGSGLFAGVTASAK